MVRVEGDGETVSASFPFGAFLDAAVGDVAESAVGSAKAFADPVGELAADGAICVVDADESGDRAAGLVRFGHVFELPMARTRSAPIRPAVGAMAAIGAAIPADAPSRVPGGSGRSVVD